MTVNLKCENVGLMCFTFLFFFKSSLFQGCLKQHASYITIQLAHTQNIALHLKRMKNVAIGLKQNIFTESTNKYNSTEQAVSDSTNWNTKQGYIS